MAFKDSFHEVAPGQRVNGSAVVFVIRSAQQRGPGSGAEHSPPATVLTGRDEAGDVGKKR